MMPKTLTIDWLKELIGHQIENHLKENSMLLESPYDNNDKEIRNDLAWSELKDILNGRTSVKSLAIMTPENPLQWKGDNKYDRNTEAGAALRNSENANRRKQFEDLVEEAGLSIYSIGGSYGIPESSYIIPAMNRETATKLGQQYGQDSVIYAEKEELPGGSALAYKMIYTSRGKDYDKSAGVRYVVLDGEIADERDDLYSEYNGVKFVIPFYDPAYEGKYPWDMNDPEDPDIENPAPETGAADEDEVSVES